MSRKEKRELTDELYSVFEELKTLGDEILMPNSVVSDVICEKSNGSDKTREVSHLHRFDFGDFFISLVYTPNRSSLTAAPSVLEARICLDKTEPLFFLTPYDVIPYINSSDLICRYFPYIESPERLKSCYRDLAESLVPYLGDFTRIAASATDTAEAYHHLREEMKRCYGEDIFFTSGKGGDYDNTLTALRFYHFVKWKSSFYCSSEYNDFLTGNYASLSALTTRKYIPDFVRHIALSVPALTQAPIVPVRPESASLSGMVSATRKASSIPILLLSCLMTLPVVAALGAILYFSVAALLGNGYDYYTALSGSGFVRNLNVIGIAAILLAPSFSPVVRKLFFKNRYKTYRPYRLMAKKNPSRSTVSGLKTIILFLAVIFTTLSACRGVMIGSTTVVAQQKFFPWNSRKITYNEMDYVAEYTRDNGSFYYVITLKDGTTLSLEDEMTSVTCERVKAVFSPKLDENGIVIIPEEELPDTDSTSDTEGDTTPETTSQATAETTSPTTEETPKDPAEDTLGQQ